MLTPTERADIYRQVRAILVRQWIDLGYLNIHVGSMAVNLSGRLQQLEHAGPRLDADLVDLIMGDIQRIRGVKQVIADFDNWKQTKDDHWYCTDKVFGVLDPSGVAAPHPPAAATATPDAGPQTPGAVG